MGGARRKKHHSKRTVTEAFLLAPNRAGRSLIGPLPRIYRPPARSGEYSCWFERAPATSGFDAEGEHHIVGGGPGLQRASLS
jgi:hypothetical protein